MSQLYNRNLLSTIDVADIRSLVDRAIKYLEESGDDIDAQVKQALIRRLRFRDRFLEAVSSTTEIVRASSKQNFVDALSFIRPIEESTTLGRAVEEAFSVKLQRRLASTLPPRPMVKIKFQDAIAFLRRLCQDAIDMHELFDYSCAYDLRVRLRLRCSSTLLTKLGIPLANSFKEAPSWRIHSMLAPGVHSQRYPR